MPSRYCASPCSRSHALQPSLRRSPPNPMSSPLPEQYSSKNPSFILRPLAFEVSRCTLGCPKVRKYRIFKKSQMGLGRTCLRILFTGPSLAVRRADLSWNLLLTGNVSKDRLTRRAKQVSSFRTSDSRRFRTAATRTFFRFSFQNGLRLSSGNPSQILLPPLPFVLLFSGFIRILTAPSSRRGGAVLRSVGATDSFRLLGQH